MLSTLPVTALLLSAAAGLSSATPLSFDNVVSLNRRIDNSHNLNTNTRRHHAKLAASKRNASVDAGLTPHTSPNKRGSLLSGNGFGTLYYDMNGGGTCGPANGWYNFAETSGYAMCEPNSGYKTLAQRGSNRVVAMASHVLSGNLGNYCGKEVKVTWNGKTVDNLVIWDGCDACNSGDGLDFSSTVFAEIFGEDNCSKGKIYDMQWEITDNQLWEYPSGNVISGGGSGSSDNGGDDVENDGGDDAGDDGSDDGNDDGTCEEDDDSEDCVDGDEEETSASSPPEPTTTEKPWSSSSSWTSSSSTKTKTPKPTTKSTLQPNNAAGGTKTFQASSTGKELVVDTSTADGDGESTSLTSTTTITRATSSKTQKSAATSLPATPSNDGQACNDSPGAWVCNGNTLQQCIQTTGDWVWSTRVYCNVSPINCNSNNPVCPDFAKWV